MARLAEGILAGPWACPSEQGEEMDQTGSRFSYCLARMDAAVGPDLEDETFSWLGPLIIRLYQEVYPLYRHKDSINGHHRSKRCLLLARLPRASSQ
jgi:hypothetical protein